MSETQERNEPDGDRGLSDYGPGGGEDDGHDYVDRSKLDFDPADGLYSGTAVEGTSEIPGPHEHGDDNEGGDSPSDGDDAN